MRTPTPGVEQIAYGRGKVDGLSGIILFHFAGNQKKIKTTQFG